MFMKIKPEILIKNKTIATFGAFFHVTDVFERLGIGKMLIASQGKQQQNALIQLRCNKFNIYGNNHD